MEKVYTVLVEERTGGSHDVIASSPDEARDMALRLCNAGEYPDMDEAFGFRAYDVIEHENQKGARFSAYTKEEVDEIAKQ